MRPRHRGTLVVGLAALVAVLLTAGCSVTDQDRAGSGWKSSSAGWSTGWLPSDAGVTGTTGRVIALWNGAWVAALVIAGITWGLAIWCIVVYRRRRTDRGVPVQLRYNMPLEAFYTVVPVLMVLVFFYFTARDETVITARHDKPDTTIAVVGKQWSWDFNYLTHDGQTDDVFTVGTQAHLTGATGVPETLPTLHLPVGRTVELKITSRDVNHSFWVPAFLEKIDAIPGRTNYMTLTPERVGTFDGKCAELCGEYHSEMLFRVKVESQADYDAYLAQLASDPNARGRIDCDDLNRADTTNTDGQIGAKPATCATEGN